MTLEPVGLPVQLESTGGALSLGPEGVALVLTPGYSLDLTYEHTSHDWVLADLDTGQVLRRGAWTSTRSGWRARRTVVTPPSPVSAAS